MCDLKTFEAFLRECYRNGDNDIYTSDIIKVLNITQNDIERWCEILQNEEDMEYYLYYDTEGCSLEFYF